MSHQSCNHMSHAGSRQSHFEDEALETFWELREKDSQVKYEDLNVIMCKAPQQGRRNNEERMKRFKDNGLFELEDGNMVLTPAGESRARDIIRRHRLAERLFADVLDIKDFEADACRLEHALSPGSEEAICTLLGHPPRCPHGKPIPKGECCAVYTRKVAPLTQRLIDTEAGKTVRVMFIQGASVDRLATMGLVPGTTIRLNQKSPAFVIEIGETTVAIDSEIAEGIYVKQA